jgi:hypothetical protein
MAENFRRGDRVEWHNSPQMTTAPQDLKRAKGERSPGHEQTASDDGGEASTSTDHR